MLGILPSILFTITESLPTPLERSSDKLKGSKTLPQNYRSSGPSEDLTKNPANSYNFTESQEDNGQHSSVGVHQLKCVDASL